MVIASRDLDLRGVRMLSGALLRGRIGHDKAHVSVFKTEDLLLAVRHLDGVERVIAALHLRRVSLRSEDEHAGLGLLLTGHSFRVKFKCVVLSVAVTGLFRPTRDHHPLQLLRRLEKSGGRTTNLVLHTTVWCGKAERI